MRLQRFRAYWTATGVIPRWQLVLVYALIVGAGIAGFAKIQAQQDDIKDLVASIQESRVVLTARSCRQRNNERAITRANLRQNKANLAQIPDEGLAALGFTRTEAIAQLNHQLRQVRPIDCKRQIREVSGKQPVSGGGSRSPNGGRRPPTRQKPSKDTQHGDGGPGAPQPERPPGGGGQAPVPPPGDSQPAPGNGAGPSGPNPSVRPPVVTVPDVRELPRQVAPELCRIDTPLGPILKICP